jgi:hypothetical protein
VTPTPSETLSELILSPVGMLSVFEFKTAIPWPFGQERGGDLVANFSQAVTDATRSGALLVVSPWDDPIGSPHTPRCGQSRKAASTWNRNQPPGSSATTSPSPAGISRPTTATPTAA